jgi:hypothetical protein
MQHERIYVKGHLAFTLGEHNLEFVHRNLSVFGAMGLPWATLSPKEHFAHPVSVQLRLPSQPDTIQLQVAGYIMREYTLYAERMGIRFQLDPAQRELMSGHIANFGFLPTDHVRKYPRIPQNAAISTYPLRVMGVPADNELALEGLPVIFDVQNLSPNGVLLSTENQLALSLAAGQRLDLTLEPRGNFPLQVQVQGLICRITDALHPDSGNLIRYIGMKFTRVDELNRAAFLDLLKDILEKLNASGRTP